MRRNTSMIIFALIGLFVYLIIINMIAYSMSYSPSSGSNQEYSETSGDVKVGVSDKIDVTVTRNRWYGTIIENSGASASSKLYLFNIIALPSKSGGKSLLLAHVFLLAILCVSLYFINSRLKKHDFERGII